MKSTGVGLTGILLLATTLWSCQPKDSLTKEQTKDLTTVQTLNIQPPATLIWPLATQMNEASLAAATILHQAIQALLQAPTAESLAFAQQQWRKTHKALQELSLFANLCANNHRLRSLHITFYNTIAWPFEPGYVDSFGAYRFSGLVNDISMSINAESLREQHGLSDESALSLGIYPLGYLLFGHLGNRLPADFNRLDTLNKEQQKIGFTTPEELPNNRRRVLLQLQSQLLLEDLQSLHTQLTSRLTDSAFDRYRNIPKQQQTTKLLQAIQQTLIEQMTTVSKEQQYATDRIDRLTLTQRLLSQSTGIEAILSALYNAQQIAEEIKSLDALYAALQTIAAAEKDKTAKNNANSMAENTATEQQGNETIPIWAPVYTELDKIHTSILRKLSQLQLLVKVK